MRPSVFASFTKGSGKLHSIAGLGPHRFTRGGEKTGRVSGQAPGRTQGPPLLEPLEGRTLLSAPPVYPLTAIPVFHSNPNAAAKLYLDFDGDPASSWNGYTVPATPAYSLDSDPTTVSDYEIQQITEIWARVSEKYSPFNLDVTTQNPGTLTDNVAFRVVIGGAGAWYSATPTGGTSVVGGFYDPAAPNTAYVFEDNLLNGTPQYTAEAIAHEAGHGFGLQHQSSYNGDGTLSRDHNIGDANTAPIMGTSYYAARGLWWDGTSTSSTTIQDDLAVLSGPLDGFGYRADDYGNTPGTANVLTPSGNNYTASGIIEQTSDADYFQITTTSDRNVSFTASPAQYGPMLDLKLELHNAADGTLVSADTASPGESFSVNVPAGTYYVVVKSHGNYGDIGQYTLSGSVTAINGPVANAGGPYVVAEGSSISLDGSASTGSGLTYAWDLDGDGIYGETGSSATRGDETGATPTFSAAGLDGPGTWNVGLRVTDTNALSSTTTAAITLTNAPPAASVSGNNSVNEGASYSLNLSATDPGENDTISWSVDWGDNTFSNASGLSATATHAYADNGSYTIIVVAMDKDSGLSPVAAKAVTVTNVPPAAALTGSATGTEGSPYFLGLSATDAGSADTITWLVNWGDGQTSTASGSSGTLPHVYADDGNYLVWAVATDDDGASTTQITKSIAIGNLAPVATLNGAGSADEGSTYTLGLQATDAGTNDTITWSIDWGDGSPVSGAIGRTASPTHIYLDNGNYTITATATDKDGGSDSSTLPVRIDNVAPTADASGQGVSIAGQVYSLNLTATDPGLLDSLSWSVDWGDGSADSVYQGAIVLAQHTYADEGAFTITATASDSDGASAHTSVNLAVAPADPPQHSVLPGTWLEGSPYTVTLSSAFEALGNVTAWSVDWGDGSAVANLDGSAASTAHTYVNNGSYTLTISAADQNGDHDTQVDLAVLNVAPAALISGSASVAQGSSYALAASATDAGSLDTISWSIDWGDGQHGTASGANPSLSHTYSSVGIYTIHAIASDNDGGASAAAIQVVTVTNVPPAASIVGSASASEGSVYTLNLTATDPGANDVISWIINWGDGSSSSTSGRSLTFDHTYGDNGDYTISAVASDANGGASPAATRQVSVSNVAPTLTIQTPDDAVQGTQVSISLGSSDPGSDTISGWSIDWGDGSSLAVAGNATSATHTYANWGSFDISVQATDEDGKYSASTSILVHGDTQPAAVLSATEVSSKLSAYTFDVAFSDTAPIDLQTLDDQDILVSGPGGLSQGAKFMGQRTGDDGSIIATYQITPPHATWTDLDDGTYTVSLSAGQVGNQAGNFAAAGALGTFQVKIPIPDHAGNTTKAARTTPSIKAGSKQAYTDYVGTGDTNDYYKLRVLKAVKFKVKVSGAGANLQVLQKNKALKVKRTRSGSSTTVTITLKPGTYYLRAYCPKSSIHYKLNLSAGAA